MEGLISVGQEDGICTAIGKYALAACNKEVDYYPDVISEDTVWYNP